mmetsp:Transcript_37925/g.74245  ORF Transcript_37925/g.74245 Transcript_37925/m.74245 type:complete len:88 (+) Transcript_37925:903-1166(+)
MRGSMFSVSQFEDLHVVSSFVGSLDHSHSQVYENKTNNNCACEVIHSTFSNKKALDTDRHLCPTRNRTGLPLRSHSLKEARSRIIIS